MARETAMTRWPKIVQGMIGDVEMSMDNSPGQQHTEERRAILFALQQLKDQVLQNSELQ